MQRLIGALGSALAVGLVVKSVHHVLDKPVYVANDMKTLTRVPCASTALPQPAFLPAGQRACGQCLAATGSTVSGSESGTKRVCAPGHANDADEFLLPDTCRALYMIIAGAISHTVMRGLNSLELLDEHGSLERVLRHRPPNQGLITVSNHTSAADDPLTVAMFVYPRELLEPRYVRWTLCATDRCFKTPLMSRFFTVGKVLPIERGAGLRQPGMLVALDKLRRGDWLHVFPEGTRSRDGTLGRMKPGIGSLVAGVDPVPMVLPFVHSGMEHVLGVGRSMFRGGHRIRLLVGEPLDFRELIAEYRAAGRSERELYQAIADRIGVALAALKAQVDAM